MEVETTLRVNGTTYQLFVDTRTTLVDADLEKFAEQTNTCVS